MRHSHAWSTRYDVSGAPVIDLARFAAAFHDPGRSDMLKPGSIQEMHEPPPAPVSRDGEGKLNEVYYGCGWAVRRVGNDGRKNTWHAGSLPGAYSLLVRRWNGLSWVVLFNQRSGYPELPDGAIDPALHRAADAVEDWPGHDLFEEWRR